MENIKMIEYRGQKIKVRGGAWCDDMNSCFYTVIDKIKGYNICQEIGSNEIFALPNLK